MTRPTKAVLISLSVLLLLYILSIAFGPEVVAKGMLVLLMFVLVTICIYLGIVLYDEWNEK